MVRPGDLEVLLRLGEVAWEVVAVDGTALRGSHEGTSAAAARAQDGSVVAQQRVADKSNEIPALAPLLSVWDLPGVVVTVDALHTQVETATVLVEEKGADGQAESSRGCGRRAGRFRGRGSRRCIAALRWGMAVGRHGWSRR